MNPRDFRKAFAELIGHERYRQFVHYLNREGRWRGRFLFWQEKMLEEIRPLLPIDGIGFEQIESLLRVCEFHGDELQQDCGALSQRCRGAVTEYTAAQAESFPDVDCGPIVMGRRFDNFRYGLWYCPTCRAAEVVYQEKLRI